MVGRCKDNHERRQSTLAADMAAKELKRYLFRFRDNKEAFLQTDGGLKGMVTVDEFFHRLAPVGRPGKLTKQQLRSLLKSVPGRGGDEAFDFDRFARMLDRVEMTNQAGGGDGVAEQPRDDSARSAEFEGALRRVRDQLWKRRMAIEPPLSRADGEVGHVIEKWVANTFPPTRSLLGYDELLDAIDSLGADVQTEDINILLSAVDPKDQGFLTVPNLLLTLLDCVRVGHPKAKEEALNSKSLAVLEAFCKSANEELDKLYEQRRRLQSELDETLARHAAGELSPEGCASARESNRPDCLDALLPDLRQMERPKTCPSERFSAGLGGFGTELLAGERMARRERKMRNRLYDPPLGSEQNASAAKLTPPLKRVTRTSSTPAFADTFARVGVGRMGVSPASGLFQSDAQRLHSTSACAYQAPSSASSGALEFSSSLEARVRRARQQRITARKRAVEARVEQVTQLRNVDFKIEHAARAAAKATLRLEYAEMMQNGSSRPARTAAHGSP